MKRNRIIYGLLLGISAVVFVASNHRGALFFLICFIVTGVLSLLLLLLEKKNNSLTVTVPDHHIMTESLAVRFTSIRRRPIPSGHILLDVDVENALYEEHHSVSLILEPANRKLSEYEMLLKRLECGKFKVTFKKVRMRDLLGIWQLQMKEPEPVEYLAYPKIPEIELTSSNRQFENREGQHYNPNKGGDDVTEVHDLKEYHAGDSLSSIHWKLSSKMDKLIAREFGSPINQESVILYDGAFFGYSQSHELVNAVLGMTAAISQAMIQSGRIHSICRMNNHQMVFTQIESLSGMLDCLTEFLESHLAAMTFSSADFEPCQNIGQIFMITGYLDEEMCSHIGEYTNLIVILMTESQREYIEDHARFKIIAIPISKMDGQMHQFEI